MAEVPTTRGHEPEPLSAAQEAIARWLAQRRVYLFVMVFFLIGAGAGVRQDPAGATPYDWAYIAVLVAGFGVVLVPWRRRTLAAVAAQQNLLLVMTLILLVVTVPLLALFPLHTAGGAVLFSAMLVLNRLWP